VEGEIFRALPTLPPIQWVTCLSRGQSGRVLALTNNFSDYLESSELHYFRETVEGISLPSQRFLPIHVFRRKFGI
jgi:hypothetical protein